MTETSQQPAAGAINDALGYAMRGWCCVPIPAGHKGPLITDWQHRQWQLKDFTPTNNIGVILGHRSGNLVDVDLDCQEALVLAPIYLPPTRAIFGRNAKPQSHWLYISPGAQKTTFADPLRDKKNTLLELRSDGRDGGTHQTLFPPSIADGERREWHGSTIEPMAVDAIVLHQRCTWLAIGCLVLRHVSETAARRPGHDLPHLLHEAEPVLGRKAFAWLGLPDPDAPQHKPKLRRPISRGAPSLWELAEAIPNDVLSWDDWNAFGLAFYAASGGDGDGFLAFDRFSSKCGKYIGPETLARWRHYAKSPPSATGLGKLIKAAIAAGWRSHTGGRHAI